MSRLISDKYREAQRQYLERFNQLKANEEELNRIFIDIYGLQEELTPDVADKDVTVYRIIDEPSDEERKMRYVLSMRDEIVSLLSYIVGCILGRPAFRGRRMGRRADSRAHRGRREGLRFCRSVARAFLPGQRRHCADHRRGVFPG